MTRGLVVLGLICVPLSVAADGAEGRWALEALHPVACESLPGAQLTVKHTGFEMTDGQCRFATPLPAGFSGMAGPVRCETGGTAKARDVDLILDGDRLHLRLDDAAPAVFRRC